MDIDVLAAAIAAALRKVMQEEGVATKSDRDKIGATSERHEQNMDCLETRFEALAKQESWVLAPGTPSPLTTEHWQQQRERWENQNREYERYARVDA